MSQTITFDPKDLRVAFVSDDGINISQHFGRAMYYEVLTIKDSKVISTERREKAGHHTFHSGEGHQHHHDESPDHQLHKHNTMITPITDCDILVTRGMGNGAYLHLTSANITPVITSHRTINEAAEAIIKGSIEDHTERLH